MVLKNSGAVFKSKNVRVNGYYAIIIFLILIFLDRLTKIWASNLSINKDYGLLALTYTANSGAGFSILQNMNMLLIIISIIALIALVYFYNHIPRFSLIMIISGIVGNLIDRIFYGSVVDFINFKFWPVFNVADALICIGVIYWIVKIFRDDRLVKDDKNKKKNKVKKR
jgi:signal peptidase II